MKGIPEKLVILEVRRAPCAGCPEAWWSQKLGGALGTQGPDGHRDEGLRQAEAERSEPVGKVKQIPRDWRGPGVRFSGVQS